MIVQLRHFLPRKIVIQIFNSLVGPYISYAITVWGSADKCHLKPLLVLQKKAIRMINNSHFRDASAPIFYGLKLLPISEVFDDNCLKFLYKCLKEDRFPTLRKRILDNNAHHNHETRYKSLLNPPYARLHICRKAYLSHSIFLWNNLESSVKESKSLNSFKFKIKQILLDKIKPPEL